MSSSPSRAAHRKPRVRHGAHRTRTSLLSAVMPSLLAVAAVAALVTSLAVWQAEESDRPRAAASGNDAMRSGATPAAGASGTSDGVATPSPAVTPADDTQSPEVSGTPDEPSPDESKDESKNAVSEEEPAAEPPDAATSQFEVVVLNQTTRRGLAGSVAEQLRAAGWDVPGVGNFRGIVPATTVYYPPGADAAALAVARDLPTAPRVRPRFGNLSTSRLTVVVTDSYPG